MSDQVLHIQAGFPPTLIDPLINSTARYVILHGGRAGGKSWAVARALLIRAANKTVRVLCCRQYMANMSESVHKLLTDQIHALGLQDRFIVEKSRIYGLNGSEFNFAGIQNNPAGLKSYEGVDVAWVEEAAGCTAKSWSILIPTIRKTYSQIIVTFNPELATDDTWQRFVVNSPPDSCVVRINYNENPYCPDVMHQEAEYMRQTDPDAYQNVWLGYPRVYLENAVYGKELRQAVEEGRITSVPYDPLVPVHCFWDLGWRDSTSIIMAQMVGFEFHIIDFLEANQTTTAEYLNLLQKRKYTFGVHYLPHDGAAHEKGTGRSIEEIIRSHGHMVKIVPRLSVPDGINAARMIWDRCWIDEKRCGDLLQSLRRYVWDSKTLPTGEVIAGAKPHPVHSAASHAADAWRYMALSLRAPKDGFRPREPVFAPTQTGWMA